MRHIINVDDLREWECEHEFAASYGNGSHKSLRLYFKDGYSSWRIYNHRELVSEVISPVHAVEVYNSLK